MDLWTDGNKERLEKVDMVEKSSFSWLALASFWFWPLNLLVLGTALDSLWKWESRGVDKGFPHVLWLVF